MLTVALRNSTKVIAIEKPHISGIFSIKSHNNFGTTSFLKSHIIFLFSCTGCLFQKHLFLDQLTHSMTKDCLWTYREN